MHYTYEYSDPAKKNKQNKQTVKIKKDKQKQIGKRKIQVYQEQDVVVKKKIRCNYTIGLHEFLEDRHKVNVSMKMKGN